MKLKMQDLDGLIVVEPETSDEYNYLRELAFEEGRVSIKKDSSLQVCSDQNEAASEETAPAE